MLTHLKYIAATFVIDWEFKDKMIIELDDREAIDRVVRDMSLLNNYRANINGIASYAKKYEKYFADESLTTIKEVSLSLQK